MKILGIESSSLVASAAILADDTIIAEYTVNYKKTHSHTLLPMIDEIVRMTDTDLETIDAIAVSAGPGSFTGLRIGAATAKGLGLALDKPLIAVPTLDATAMNIPFTDRLICPVMDARRNQVYNGLYRYDGSELVMLVPSRAADVAELVTELNERNEAVIFLGDGVPVYRKLIDEKAAFPHDYAPAGCSRQRAACVALLGARLFAEGKQMTSDDFVPEYLRKSQAEREREGV